MRPWPTRTVLPGSGRVGGVPRAQDVATPAAETIEVRRLAVDDVDEQLDALAEVLVDCVAGGASVSYLLPFSRDDARVRSG